MAIVHETGDDNDPSNSFSILTNIYRAFDNKDVVVTSRMFLTVNYKQLMKKTFCEVLFF